MTVRMDDYEEYDYAMHDRGWLAIEDWEASEARYGTFHYKNGDMRIYQQRHPSVTRIRATSRGRTYNRVWRKVWTDNTLSRLCRQFADDLEAKQ